MNAVTTQHNWSMFRKLFSEQNRMRPTRLGIFQGEPGAMTEHWIEDGLPLVGIDVEVRGEDAPTIEIMIGGSTKTDSSHLTHTVAGARFAKIVLSANGEADGLEIEDFEGETTILRFEN